MKLHNRKGFINSAPEGQPKTTKKPRLTQWLYFMLLAFMIGYIIYLVAKPYFVIATNGIVDVENKYVFADRAGLVKEINATPDQIFKQGSLLATLSPEKSCIKSPDPRLEKLTFDIEVTKTQRLALIKEQEYLKIPVSSPVTIQRALELNSSLFIEQNTQQLNQDKQIQILKYDIEQKNAQIQAMNTRLINIQNENNHALPEPECIDKAIYASRDGQISIINVDHASYVKKGDILITYRDMEPVVKIVMLADIELYQDLIKQPALTVTFPDGTESLAKIQRVESAASNISLNINEVLSNEIISLRVILIPEDKNSRAHWRKYERMSVSVRGVR